AGVILAAVAYRVPAGSKAAVFKAWAGAAAATTVVAVSCGWAAAAIDSSVLPIWAGVAVTGTLLFLAKVYQRAVCTQLASVLAWCVIAYGMWRQFGAAGGGFPWLEVALLLHASLGLVVCRLLKAAASGDAGTIFRAPLRRSSLLAAA